MKRTVLREVGKLVEEEVEYSHPKKGQVLLRVERCGVCGSDISAFHGRHPYVHCPIVLGHEFAGTVVELGPGITELSIGARVTVIPHVVCGNCQACKAKRYNFCEKLRVLGAQLDGAYAEYINVLAEMALPIPSSMSMDDAALVEPISVGYHAAKRGNIRPDDDVLVVGAGPIGISTMQSCQVLGAKKVLIADIDAARLKLAKQLGAYEIIDTTKENIIRGLKRIIGGPKKIDLFFDCVGGKGQVFDQIIQIARRGTRIVVVGVLSLDYSIPHLPDFIEHELLISGTTMYVPQDYREIISLISSGKIKTKGIITHYYTLDQIIEAFDMIERRKEKFFKIMFKAVE